MSTRTLLSRLFTVAVCLTAAGCTVAPVSESGQPAVAHRTVPATARKSPVHTSVPGAGSTAGTIGSSDKGGVLGGFHPPSGGANPPPPPENSDDALALSHDEEGALVVSKEAQRFNETYPDCDRSANKPVFLCSGIIFRGTAYSPSYHAWVPNPFNPKGDGVSFSYLRQGATFSKLAFGYTSGFIIYPPLSTPPSLYQLEVLCAYPVDSNSDYRVDLGCGYNRVYPRNSGPCQDQGIQTTSQWLSHYRTPGVSSHQYQCGFTMRIGTYQSAPAFMAVIGAMGALGAESFAVQNELIIGSWKDRPDAIGIEAFFYLGQSKGLADAQAVQRDFYNTVGVWRPIVRMTLPRTMGASVTFSYVSSEQGVR
ncbi:hypothetical protein [Luteibacter sp. ME-Dv--P-043b]|uniref:hypothetical protein n=1 Tax=Luteibacter sp. ME-Dv--P-043b TaxID=3040291 RepID=UPI0025570A67|nr:hypothetical protein [Luteibacter sp. ME-Dv--P-043b]